MGVGLAMLCNNADTFAFPWFERKEGVRQVFALAFPVGMAGEACEQQSDLGRMQASAPSCRFPLFFTT